MKTSRRRFGIIILLISGCLVVFCAFDLFLVFHGPYYFNTSNSMPKGVYVRTNRPVHDGSLVIVSSSVLVSFGEKLPKYLLKKVLRYHGEIVTINQVGLSLNSTLIARREIAKGVYYKSALPPGLVLLVGESERSFDSRYFGPVRTRDLTEVRPIMTW